MAPARAAAIEGLKRVSTTDQVQRALRAAIISNVLTPGEQLRETRLAATLSTSRGAIREALRTLAQEGLVDYELHRGHSVAAFGPDDLVDVYLAREAIETAAAQLIQSRRPDLTPLEERLAAMEAVAARRGDDWQEMAEVDVAFHEELVAIAASPRLCRMYATLAAETRILLRGYPPYSSERNVDDHRKILIALREGRPDPVRLLREHLRFSSRLAVEWKRGQDA